MSNCKSCGGCGKDLTMTPQEIQVLYKFAQFPFLPVARRIDDTSPVFLEDNDYAPEQYSLILGLLERKGLITISAYTHLTPLWAAWRSPPGVNRCWSY